MWLGMVAEGAKGAERNNRWGPDGVTCKDRVQLLPTTCTGRSILACKAPRPGDRGVGSGGSGSSPISKRKGRPWACQLQVDAVGWALGKAGQGLVLDPQLANRDLCRSPEPSGPSSCLSWRGKGVAECAQVP